MTNFKSIIRPWWLALAIICAALPGFAQPGKLQLDNLDKLSSKAAVVNDVSLDGALLDMAARVVQNSNDPDAAEVKEVVKGLKGIYIKNFEFDQPHEYSQEDVRAIRSQLAQGWTRIVQSNDKRQDELDEIYILKEKDSSKIAGVTILVAEPKELTVVNIVGNVDLDRLGALAGKFGIPDEIKDKTGKPKSTTPSPAKPDQKESQDDDQDSIS